MSLPITSGMSPALSGLRAAQLRLDSSAHNVANLQTPDFRRQEVTQSARTGHGGVDARVGHEATRPPPGAQGFGRLAEDLVGQRISLYSFKANLNTLKAHDRMLGALLDTRA
ncbi:MAG TPA: flagellar basal body rod protein [Hydrogenophaga sp.]|uniref:flagellar basal body rod protein n=1 Tax=Hydrogenophaga sp. TaxID=1904254 RepID=UPI002CCD81A5|nr:flagellar basal body rod protein [Hydrogenophaga sp.]HMN94271.1 flagellar basal body rod protein [Hydrogenophaga sp.]HMP11017.1 flagellar basal body rod protein [Hydrogenophaga sp.]